MLGMWARTIRNPSCSVSIEGDEQVVRYLSRMDVFRALEVGYNERFVRHPSAGRFIPVKFVADSSDCNSAVNAICDLVTRQFDDAPSFLPAMEWAVNEVIDNILIHSEAESGGAVCAQYFPNRHCLEIGVCDMGRGLKASLLGAYAPRSDRDAIAKAIQRGVTRDSAVGMGNGLAGTIEIVKANGGELEIWSGTSTLVVSASASRHKPHAHIQGTGLRLSLNTNQPVDLSATFIGSPGWTYLEAEAERVADSGGLRVVDECASTGNRQPAELLRRKVLALLPELDEQLTIDFSGTSTVSSSFLDELLGRLADALGIEKLKERIAVINASAQTIAMANVVIEQRLATITPQPTKKHTEASSKSQGIPTPEDSVEADSIISRVSRTLAEFDGLKFFHDPPVMPETSGAFSPIQDLPLNDELKSYLTEHFKKGLFTHQHQAIQRIAAGTHTVVATRTSSGKSLIYSLPVFDSLLNDGDATAMFLYPQKALANDQLIKLRQALDHIPTLGKLAAKSEHFVSRYDGSTKNEDRQEIRERVQLVLTNPDMLHVGILQWHKGKWERFLSKLRYVIIDECHEYRGIFGTNVAYILRRLRQLCSLYGSSPTFIATSATVAEPKSHLEKLVGVPFECVGSDQDGSSQGRRKLWMVGSEDHHYDFGRKLTMRLADHGLSVLTFCPSRKSAEKLMSRSLPTKKDEEGDPAYVRVYRAGLSPAAREGIEKGLRDKTVKAVYSTSALELGIDIGAIDVVICIGLPPSMMSMWQRAGRAARAGKEGAVLLVPADSPIDSYYADAPSEFFGKDHEPLVLNLTNRRVVYQHYACSIHELGGIEDGLKLDIFGPAFETVQAKRKAGELDEVEIFYVSDPHMAVNIRSMGDGAYDLEVDKSKIGEIDSFHLLTEAYRNAIYRHGGEAFRVQAIRTSERKVRLKHEYSGNETTSYIQKKITLKRIYSQARYDQILVATAGIDAKEYIVNVVEKNRSGETVHNWPGSAGTPTHRLPTGATLLRIQRAKWATIADEIGEPAAETALRSCERLLWSLFPTITGPCDTQDFSSACQIAGDADIYLYDLVYDGADIAFAAFDRMSDLLEKSLERLNECECEGDEGCHRCIANPRIEEPTSKIATRKLLEAILEAMSSVTPTVSHKEPTDEETLSAEPPKTCANEECGVSIPARSKFCLNCGTPVGE